MIFQNLDCRGTSLQEGGAQRNVGMVSNDLLQIFFGVRRVIGRTERRCMARVGYPDRSADSAEVPPTNPVFSTSSVFAPRMAEKSAADMPAAPAPITTTS
jgi:hypothetical protein